MTDNKTGGLVRNAFSRKSKYLRRNSRESRWIRATPKVEANVARRPQIMHPKSLAISSKAFPNTPLEIDTGSIFSWDPSSNLNSPNRPLTQHDIDQKEWHTGTTGKAKARRHSSPISPIGLGISIQQRSLNSSSTDGSHPRFYYKQVTNGTPELKTKSKPKFFGLPANPKPGYQWKEYRPLQKAQNEPLEEVPKNVGWDHIRFDTDDLNRQRDASAVSNKTSWPESGANINTKSKRSQSNQAYMNKFHGVTTKIAKVYKQGPKGEGQKLWKSLRNGRRAAMGKQDSNSLYARKKDTQLEQLNKVYAASTEFPTPKPVISDPLPIPTTLTYSSNSKNAHSPPKVTTRTMPSPLQSHPVPPPIPARPESLGFRRSPVPVESLRDSMFIPPITSDVVSMSSSRTASIPIMLTRRMQTEAARTPDKKTEEKKLPPRPAPAPGEREPPEVKDQAKMYKLRVGISPPQSHASTFGPPFRPAAAAAAVKATNAPNQSTLAVGPDSRFAHKVPASNTQSNLVHFASLDDRLTRHRLGKPKDKEKKHRFADAVFHFFDTPVSNQATRSKEVPVLKHPEELITNIVSARQERARMKHEEKLQQLKQEIGYPKPIDIEAASAAPPIPIKSPERAIFSDPAGKLQKSDTFSEGDQLANMPPPVPPLPHDYTFPVSHSSTDLKGKEKESKPKDRSDKKHKANWAGAVYDILPGRKRPDSGDSFGCIDAHRVTEQQRRIEQYRKIDDFEQRKPVNKRDSGVMSGFQVFRGPVRVGKIQVRDPGPSRQAGHARQYSEETLVPNGLNIRKVERDTDFYQPVHSVINGYAGDWI